MSIAKEYNFADYDTGCSVFRKKGDYVCWKIDGAKSISPLTEIKNFIKHMNDEVGNEDSDWRAFDLDRWSVWFVVTNNCEILSTMRVVTKRPNNLIPLEIGLVAEGMESSGVAIEDAIRNKPRRYAVLDDKSADWNSVAFPPTKQGYQAAALNFGCVAKYCVEQDFSRVFGMYSPFRKGIERVYKRAGAIRSSDFPGPIFFPGFKCNGNLVLFQIIEIPKKSLQKLALGLE